MEELYGKSKIILAALVTKAKNEDLDDAMWLNSRGLGSIEDSWDEFQDAFEAIFGVSWEEAENFADEFFDGEKKRFL